MGVADGVYMWKQQGIDAGEFSRSLMRYAKQAIKDGETNPVKGAFASGPPTLVRSIDRQRRSFQTKWFSRTQKTWGSPRLCEDMGFPVPLIYSTAHW